MWDPQHLTILEASTACYGASFTSHSLTQTHKQTHTHTHTHTHSVYLSLSLCLSLKFCLYVSSKRMASERKFNVFPTIFNIVIRKNWTTIRNRKEQKCNQPICVFRMVLTINSDCFPKPILPLVCFPANAPLEAHSRLTSLYQLAFVTPPHLSQRHPAMRLKSGDLAGHRPAAWSGGGMFKKNGRGLGMEQYLCNRGTNAAIAWADGRHQPELHS
jgi:hypothetical protein